MDRGDYQYLNWTIYSEKLIRVLDMEIWVDVTMRSMRIYISLERA